MNHSNITGSGNQTVWDWDWFRIQRWTCSCAHILLSPTIISDTLHSPLCCDGTSATLALAKTPRHRQPTVWGSFLLFSSVGETNITFPYDILTMSQILLRALRITHTHTLFDWSTWTWIVHPSKWFSKLKSDFSLLSHYEIPSTISGKFQMWKCPHLKV